MYKPLSEKSLKRLYDNLALPEEDIQLVHKYLQCFSNLYGCIEILDTYQIYEHYEEDGLNYEQYLNLIKIIQRERQDYSIVDMHDIYTGEEKGLVDYLVNNKLIGNGYNKFFYVYHLEENKADRPYYMPHKEELFKYENDLFWKTEHGLAIKEFIGNLKTSGIYKDFSKTGKILDIDGNTVKGKKLKDFKFYTQWEQAYFKYYKKQAIVGRLKQEYSITALDKILNRIEMDLRVGSQRRNGFSEDMNYNVKFITDDCGVDLNEEQLRKFIELYIYLNNFSSLWQNGGYSPNKLFQEDKPRGPVQLEIGENMKKLLEKEGKYDEFMKELEEFNSMFNRNPLDLDEFVDAIIDNSVDNALYYSKSLNKIVFIDFNRIHEFDQEQVFSDLIALPDINRVNPIQIMKDYTDTIADNTIANSLRISLKGPDLYNKFAEMLENYDLFNDYFEYEDERYKEVAREWCEENNIKYK